MGFVQVENCKSSTSKGRFSVVLIINRYAWCSYFRLGKGFKTREMRNQNIAFIHNLGASAHACSFINLIY